MPDDAQPFEPPERHRALDATRAGVDRLVDRLGEALGDEAEPVVVGPGTRRMTLSQLEDRLTAVLHEYDREHEDGNDDPQGP